MLAKHPNQEDICTMSRLCLQPLIDCVLDLLKMLLSLFLPEIIVSHR